MKIATAILAAGFGTRMRSKLPKVLHLIGGRPMLEWSIRTAKDVSTRKPVVVVGHGRSLIEEKFGNQVDFVVQEELLGTGHAVQQAESLLRNDVDVRNADAVVVIYGDMPLLQPATLASLVDLFVAQKASKSDLALAMLTIVRDDPQGFGRIVRDPAGQIQAIVEEVDCTPEQKAITELNPGIYCFDADWLWDNLSLIPLSKKGEYYLTDMVGIAVEQGRPVATTYAPVDDVNGVNNRVQLAHCAQTLRQRIAEQHMLAGVTILDPDTTYIDDTVEIGQDTTILPGTILTGSTRIGESCQIGPYSQVSNSQIADHCRVTTSVVSDSVMDEHSDIGPFGHIRNGTHLGSGVHMGNFGEIKNSYLGTGSKMGHFGYVGDAQIGENVNIGAGTITCNYDGTQKHRTTVDDNVFIGSDTLLVAPVHVGENARTGAGSVVTKDVEANTLVYGVPARSKPA
ncbi:MAG: bifunctional UDP-N-acetylglucosamine diphosphorylase/glucosamine-1-phosphate N-acetyltransferase GlmU [Chloroflexota bacterium]